METAAKQLDKVDKSKFNTGSIYMNEQSLRYLFLQELRPPESNPVVFNRFSTSFASLSYQNSPYQPSHRNEYNPMT